MGVKVVIVVIAHKGELGAYLGEEWRTKSEKSKCPVAIANALQSIITNKTNVPADLRSAGIKYKDLWSA